MRRPIAGIVAVQLAINVAYLASYARGDVPTVIDLDAEGNLPTWWWSVTYLGTAVAAAALLRCERALGARSWFLGVAALAFAWLSVEEVASIHETAGHHLSISSDISDWTILYLPAVALGAVAVVRTAQSLPRRERLLTLAGLVVLAIGYGAEMTLMWTDDRLVESMIEENSEPIGALLVGAALARRLADRLPLVLARARDAT